jgi:hypothetical protein
VEEVMKKAIRTVLIVSAGLVSAALVGLALIGGWAPSSTAQIIDSDGCEKACYAQQALCSQACGTHINPVECDGRCSDGLEDCLRECR